MNTAHTLIAGRQRLIRLAQLVTVVAFSCLFAACASTHHRHTRAAIFVGEAKLVAGTVKGFQEPRFIHLDGEREITWTLRAPAGATAVLSGLDFVEDPSPGRTDFNPDGGTVTVNAGTPVTLRLREDATEPVYEYRITITIGTNVYEVNYPPKVIP